MGNIFKSILLTAIVLVNTYPAYADESATVDEVVACMRTAVNRFRGSRVTDVDIDERGGRRVCEIDLIGPNGRKFLTIVEIGTGRIVLRQEWRDYRDYRDDR